jgi:hypothetical protein
VVNLTERADFHQIGNVISFTVLQLLIVATHTIHRYKNRLFIVVLLAIGLDSNYLWESVIATLGIINVSILDSQSHQAKWTR